MSDLLSLSSFEVSVEATSSHTRLFFRPLGTWGEGVVLIQAQLCPPIYQHQELIQHTQLQV